MCTPISIVIIFNFYCIAMFCALGVALFVHDKWLQPQMFHAWYVSMDTSSCYMFQELQQFVSAC